MERESFGPIGGMDRGLWKRVAVEFGADTIEVDVPPHCEVLTMGESPGIITRSEEVRRALSQPIQGPDLPSMVRRKKQRPETLKVSIAVSDATRPVPYKGNAGILHPLLEILESCGISRKNISFIVATGTHRPSTNEEKVGMFGEEVMKHYRIVDHDCDDEGLLHPLGTTSSGARVSVNRIYYTADIKIVTGLVETHFMAGASGGRKSICPGLVDKRTIERFHGPGFLESPGATNLVLDGNPCHEEAMEIARMIGGDFSINVILDRHLRLAGVFAGDLERAFEEAFRRMKRYVEIPLDKPFDIVLTHGGYVGVNHYQSAKAAVGALPAVKEEGIIVVAADNRDPEPIGGPEYKMLIHLLKLQGPERYVEMLKTSFWVFTKDQWEPEVWVRVLRKVGEKGLIYCSPQISRADSATLPGRSGWDFLTEVDGRASHREIAKHMVQNALFFADQDLKRKGIEPSLAFISEGPYAVPVLNRP